MNAEFWAIIGVGVTVIGLNWRMYEGLRREIVGVRSEIADLRERIAKLEGLFEGYVRGEYRTPTPS